MFIDIKHMDSVAHRSGTGAGNKLILRNVEAVASNGWDGRLIIRVPIVPGYNDTVENLKATAAFIAKLELEEVNLLTIHRLGHSNCKYAQVPTPSREIMRSHQLIFEAAGLQCYVGSETPF